MTNVSTRPWKGRCEGRKDHLALAAALCAKSRDSVTICPMTARVNLAAILLGGN